MSWSTKAYKTNTHRVDDFVNELLTNKNLLKVQQICEVKLKDLNNQYGNVTTLKRAFTTVRKVVKAKVNCSQKLEIALNTLKLTRDQQILFNTLKEIHTWILK